MIGEEHQAHYVAFSYIDAFEDVIVTLIVTPKVVW